MEERLRPEEHAALINNISSVVSKILTERARREGYGVTVEWRLREREGGERDGRKTAV
jgi:hypothetical protein